MATFKNEDGEEFEAFTQEELEAAKATALEEFKNANPPAPAPAPEPAAPENDPVAALSKTVQDLQATLRAREIKDMAKLYAPGDVEKQKEYETNFGKLTGYENTPEGLAEQAEAAARLSGIDVTGVSVGDVAATSGGKNIDSAAQAKSSDADAALQKALGISPEDVAKYGPAVEAATKSNS